MRCIYCRQPSAASTSVEHVIPESLGNESVVLPPGIVCDGCNNYFARKVEAPFLNAPLMRVLRFNAALPSKKGRVPPMPVFSPGLGHGEVRRAREGALPTLSLEATDALAASLARRAPFTTWTPMIPPTARQASRMLAKVGVGYIAHLLLTCGKSADLVVQDRELDRAREHARRGTEPDWPVSIRSIYPPLHLWPDPRGPSHTLTEVDLFAHDDDTFLVLAVFGTELTISLTEPRIDHYEQWLQQSGNASPLYCGRNSTGPSGHEELPEVPQAGWSMPRD